jgi:subtilase family serine protease
MKLSFGLSTAALAAVFAAGAQAPTIAAVGRDRDLGLAPATQPVSFIVKLPLRNRAELEQLTTLQATPSSPLFGHFLTVAQFRARYGPTAGTIARATQALAAEGLRVTEVDSQSMRATGTTAAVNAAFGVRMHAFRDARGRLLTATENTVRPQPALASLGALVIGLNHGPKRRPHFRFAAARNRDSTLGGYWFDDLKEAYEYPEYSVGNGTGVTIATVGASDFSQADTVSYFEHERLGSGGSYLAPAPHVAHMLMPGSLSFDPNDPNSDEANLDVQQAGGSAPGASVIGIATNGYDDGFIAAYTNIDEKKTGYVAQIVSTSYGECELFYTAAYDYYAGGNTTVLTEGYHDAFLQGNAEGITFVQEGGDNSGLDCPQPGYATSAPNQGLDFLDVKGVEASADDPNVVAVGGTNLITTHSKTSLISTYVTENAFNDLYGTDDPYGQGNYVTNELWGSGGGASTIFAKPSYQNDVPTGFATRAMPDIAMHMGGCPEGAVRCEAYEESSDYVYLGGSIFEVIGTSASTPEFAGLLAVRIAKTHVPLGNANAFIYSLAANNHKNPAYSYFRQGIPGNNGVVNVRAGVEGWNQITGVGTPYAEIFTDLGGHPLAGIPQTPTNP